MATDNDTAPPTEANDTPAKSPVFLTGNLMRHVSVMSFTASIGLMAVFAVDFVDMVFIAMLGDEALAAAIGYAGTILFFTNSLNIGLSIAAGSLASRAIGRGAPRLAREYATSVAALSIVVAFAVATLVLLFMADLLAFLGASGQPAELATSYLLIMLPSMPIMSVAMIGLAVLRAHGDARRSMQSTVIGGLVNAVLDPLLIFTAGLGLEGAALASLAARVVILVTALAPAIVVHRGFAALSFATVKRDIDAVLRLGVPAVMANIATPIGTAIVMREMATIGTEAVAGMAVIARLMPVAFAVVFALSGAIGPIIGQNFGAERLDRVRGAFLSGLLFMGLYVATAAGLLLLLREQIVALFAADGGTRELILRFCGPVALMFVGNGTIFVANAAFNNLGRPIYSALVNWGRHTLGTWPLVVLGGIWFGAPGVLVGQALGGLLFAAIAVTLALSTIRSSERRIAPEPFGTEEKLHRLACHRH